MTSRFTKFLVRSLLVQAGLLLALGLMSSWFFKTIDDKYRNLISRTAADLDSVHDIASHAGISYANIAAVPLATNAQQRTGLLQVIAQERAANDRVYEALDRSTIDPALRSSLGEVIARRARYRAESDAFISSASANAALQPVANQRLLDSFVAYQKSCDDLGDRIRSKSLVLGDQVTREVGRLRSLFFLIGIVPTCLGVLVALVILYATLYLAFTKSEDAGGQDTRRAGPDHGASAVGNH
jgi:hypothetical protein